MNKKLSLIDRLIAKLCEYEAAFHAVGKVIVAFLDMCEVVLKRLQRFARTAMVTILVIAGVVSSILQETPLPL